MTHFINTQLSALGLAVAVTLVTLGSLSAVANTEVATAKANTFVAQAGVQTVTVIGHRVRA